MAVPPIPLVVAGNTILASDLNNVISNVLQAIAPTTTIGSVAVASYTFSSIPTGYGDLILASATSTDQATGQPMYMQYNGNTATNYDYTTIEYFSGDSANTIRSGETSAASVTRAGAVGVTLASQWTWIRAYTNASMQKYHYTFGARTDANFIWYSYAGHWNQTSAITSIKLFPQVGNFATSTTFALYALPLP